MSAKQNAGRASGDRKAVSRTALAIALATGGVTMGAGTALAQDGEDEIVVTGSYIRGTPETASLPVDVITAQDLAEQGSPTVTDLIRSLGVSSGIDGNTNQFTSNGLEGLGNVNLRGLGPSRTLVLFNGHRMVVAPYGIGESAQSFVDTNLIPANAIGRIEVLKDGAAATYGSDAIAGVVNFITRRGFDGFEFGGDYRFIDGSDGEYTLNGLWGWNSADGNMDLLLAGSVQHRSVLSTTERDWALRDFADNPLGGWSAISNPGRFVSLSTGASLNDPQCVLLGGILAPTCRYRYTEFDNIIEEEDRLQLYGEFNVDLTPSMAFHLEGLYAKTDIPEWQTSPSYPPQVLTSQFVPGNHPGLVSLINQTGGAASPFQALVPAGSLFIGRSFALGGFPGSSAAENGSQTGYRNYEAMRLSAGMSGSFENGTGWDVTATFMQDVGARLTYDTYIQRLADALGGRGGPNCVDSDPLTRGIQNATPGANGCLYYNPFSTSIPAGAINGVANPLYDASVANTPELADWLTDPSYTQATTQLFVLDAVLDGELGWTMGGGNVGWALGAQYRIDSYNLKLTDNTNLAVTPCPDPLDTPGVGACANATGPYAFLAGTLPADLSRDVISYFGEVRLPFTESFEAIVAARYEDYGGNVGSTFDPKVSLRLQTTPWLAFRGSAQTSFRGPTLGQLQGQFTTLQFVGPTNAFKAIDTFANPDLDPESAFSYNLGAIVESGPFTATLDYWNFSFEDPVIVEPFDSILANVLATGCTNALASRVVFSSGCTGANVQRVRTNIINGPDIETSGVDFAAEYTFDEVIGGEFTLGVNYTHLLEYVVGPLFVEGVQITLVNNSGPFPADGDLAGFLNRGTGFRSMPQDKGEVYFNYRIGGHNLRTIARYVSDYADQRGNIPASGVPGPANGGVPLTTIEDQWTVDVHYNWDLPWNGRFSASVTNVSDEDPPLAYLDLNYDPYTHDPIGRVFRVGYTQQLN
ncbi:MAG: TonB-dependent receptor [Alphaproteobacteria bacterium]|nr:TonB-dependent receptor [Alphaproteobacteria bacterium]